MKRKFLGIRRVGWLLLFLFFTSWPAMAELPTKQDVLDTMALVQNHWIVEHPDPGDNKWARATCFEGTMALFKIYQDELFYDYALNWAELHDFNLNIGYYTRNADNQCAGQTYFALNEIDTEPRKVAHIIASINEMMPWHAASDFSEVHFLPVSTEDTVEVEFDVTPLDSNIDGVIGYADSSADITGWNSMAVLVRMYTNGRFEARDGGTYRADTTITYSADSKYHVRIKLNMPSETYNVWIRPDGEAETQLAEDYAFRSDAPPTDDIGKVGLIGSTPENFRLENHWFKDGTKPETETYWWWIDALHMAMPVFAEVGVTATEESEFSKEQYLDKLWELYSHTRYMEPQKEWGLYSGNGNYTNGDYLWWRDASFVPPTKELTGPMIYWSRGNGWVLAAHVRTLERLNADDSGYVDPHYGDYQQTFEDMAMTLISLQRSDGFWNMNLDDPDHCGGIETSGTAFFTYAMAWGINQGILDEATYLPVVEAAWNGMVKHAIHPDGKLGYVQGVGLKPVCESPVTIDSTSDFGVGAFLLAGSEVLNLADGTPPVPETRAVFQAEDATIYHGQVDNGYKRYTGDGFVNYYNEVGSYVTFSVNVSGDGQRSLLMRFANGSSTNRYMDINVNGGQIEHNNVAFNPTGSWSSWGYQRVTVDLVDGSNTIQLIADQDSGGPNLDKIEIGAVPAGVNDVWYPTSDFSKIYTLGAYNSDIVTAQFDVTPLDDNIDGVIGYADSATDITGWNSMAVLVRMYTNGRFEARDGGTYRADAPIPYSADSTYHVRIEMDLWAQTYDVWVRPDGGVETQLASDYAFRSDAPPTDDIGKVGLIGNTPENFKLENHLIGDLGPWYAASDFSEVHLLPGDNTDTVTTEFDVTPLDDNIDGVIGYADSATDITGWNSMAVLVRMYTNGRFEARDGGTYRADAPITYSADSTYHVWIDMDLSSETYDVWIRPDGGVETQLASDYAFRSDAPPTDDIGKVCLKGTTEMNFELRNHMIE